MKEELGQSEKQIKELEKKVNELKEKMTFKSKDPKESENKKDKALDIINPETLDKMRRIKSLGRGAASEVFEVAREERLALKVHYQELVSEVTDDDDDEEEEKSVINFEKMRQFLREYESINQLDHANIIKAFGISFGDATHSPAILLEYCASKLRKKIKKLKDSVAQ